MALFAPADPFRLDWKGVCGMKEGTFPEPEGGFHSEVPLRLERGGGFDLEEGCLLGQDRVCG